MSIWFRRVLCFALALPLVHSAGAANREKDLPAQYRQWVKEDVAYIISSDERKQFLSLHTDAERDNFIRAFWAERNPDPGSEVNPYKDEHYRRLAYANEHFGNIAAHDGWRSDQGRIYITLGEPQQKADYELGQNVRPMQIWFYQSPTPALPTHFYVVFYKPSPSEDWQLYSPTIDTPTKLVTTTRGMNDPQQCLNIVRKSLGDEVARTVVSLLPTAPVDLSSYTPDLESDALLSNIESLADNPMTLHLLAERRAANVTTTVFYGGDAPDLQTAVFRDAEDGMTVSYLLRMPKPDPALVGALAGGKFGYRVTLRTQVSTPDGKPVYSDEQALTGALTEAAVRTAQSKIFGAEGRLPLAPGKYHIIVTLTNDLNHAGYRQQADVTVPSRAETGWGISGAVAFSQRPPVQAGQLALPFTIEGIRFVPAGVKSVSLQHGDSLRVAFQLWSKNTDPATLAATKIRVHYAYGSVGGGAPQEETEEIAGSDFDAAGNLLTGHVIPTSTLPVGNYRLVITATNESTNRNAYTALLFHVVDGSEPTGLWTVYDTPAADRKTAAQDDFRRGLSAAASGDEVAGAHWFSRARAEAPEDIRALSRLVDCLAALGQQSELARLAEQVSPSRELDLHTAVVIARADSGQGNPNHALQILEYELQFQPPSAELYGALADTYTQLGQMAKAREFRERQAKL